MAHRHMTIQFGTQGPGPGLRPWAPALGPGPGPPPGAPAQGPRPGKVYPYFWGGFYPFNAM